MEPKASLTPAKHCLSEFYAQPQRIFLTTPASAGKFGLSPEYSIFHFSSHNPVSAEMYKVLRGAVLTVAASEPREAPHHLLLISFLFGVLLSALMRVAKYRSLRFLSFPGRSVQAFHPADQTTRQHPRTVHLNVLWTHS